LNQLETFANVGFYMLLDVTSLLRASALEDGAHTTWEGPDRGVWGSLRVVGTELFLTGDIEQRIEFRRLPRQRPRFICPRCGRGAYQLRLKAAAFLCRRCSGYENRLRQRPKPPWLQAALLRERLADPVKFWRRDTARRDEQVTALKVAEALAYAESGRLVASYDNNSDSS
jgi:hypothetical protein